MSENRIIKTKDGTTLTIISTENGKVRLYTHDGKERTDSLLTANEVRELCAALRMATEESQAKLETGPAFVHTAYLEVVAMSAREAAAFIERTDSPEDLGPADGTRYREGARVWGFKVKT